WSGPMRTLPSGEAATQMTNPITTVTVTTYTQPTWAPTQPTMVSIVLAALSGAKIAHREKARIINEEIIRTCQLTLGPLRSAIVGPSWSISALVLGGRLSSRTTSILLRWLPPSFSLFTVGLERSCPGRLLSCDSAMHTHSFSMFDYLSFSRMRENHAPPTEDEAVKHRPADVDMLPLLVINAQRLITCLLNSIECINLLKTWMRGVYDRCGWSKIRARDVRTITACRFVVVHFRRVRR